MRSRFLLLLLALALNFDNNVFAQTALDTSLAPKSDEEVSSVFRDMGVVQKRSMAKGERFLLSSYMSLDFSDGPYTNYSLHINPGYAISDFVEVYANFVPFYIVSARSIVDKVAALRPVPDNGSRFSVSAARPKFQYGLEVLWAPLYGKDSLGLSKIIRSDTFLKFGASMINYDVDTGMAFKLGIGKTFFLSKNAGFRFCVDYAYIQSIIDNLKAFKGQLLTEFGGTFYF